MSLALTFLIIFLLSFTIAEIFNRPFLEGLPCAVSVIILTLYAFSFVGAMQAAAYLLMVVPFACFIVVFVKKKDKFDFSVSNLSGMLIFSAVFAYFWYIGRTSMIYDYDEFSHWALVVKNMYMYNNFGNIEPTTATFLTYPPAQGLLEYFFLKICRTYSESRMILATNVFIIAFALPVFSKAKNIFSLATGTILCLSMLFYINNGVYRSTYVDMLLGVIWGYIIVTYCCNRKKDKFTCICLSFALAVITLTKASGFGLAIGAIAVFALYEIIICRGNCTQLTKNIIYLCIPTVTMLAAKFSWSAYVNFYQLEEKFEFSAVTIDSVFDLFNGTAPGYRFQTLSNFFDAIINTEIFSLHIGITPLLVIIIPFIILFLICKTDYAKHKPVVCAVTALFAVSVIYTAGLLFSYLFSFSEYEAVRLASFDRYLTTVAAGATIILAYFIFDYLSSVNIKAAVCTVIALIFIINPAAVTQNIRFYQEMDSWANSFRGVYEWENELIEKHCPSDSTLLYMAPGSNDLVRLQAQYAFTPVSIVYPYNFSADGEKYTENSVSPQCYTLEQIRSHLIDNCDYVFLHKALPAFVEDYRQLFNTDLIVEGLYKVNKNNGTLDVVELLQ